MTGDVEFRPTEVGPEHLEVYSRLLKDVFGDEPKFTPEAIAWRYRDNPAGRVVGYDAWAADVLAAHYVTCPMQARIRGETVRGLLSLNTATHPDFQGKGLFTKLARATYERGRDLGYGFVVGVANANSTPGFTKKLEFHLVSPLDAGFVLRPPKSLPRETLDYEGDWNPAALTWRLSNPAQRYSARRSGEVSSVFAPTGRPGVRCAAFLPGAVGSGLRTASPLGLNLFLGLEPRRSLKELGWVRIPERLKPSPLNLIYRSLGDAPPALGSRIAFNFLDFDPY